MLGPGILVDVPAVLCEHWAQRFDTRGGTSPGQPTRELVGPRDGRLCQVSPWYFLTRLVPSSRLHRSSTRCRRDWNFDHRCLTLASSYFLIPSPFLLSSLFVPLLALCRRSVPAFPLTSAYLGRLFVDANDYLDHGPPRGRAAALRVFSRSFPGT